MRQTVLILISIPVILLAMAAAYAGKGYVDARGDAADLSVRAATLSEEGRGAGDLNPDALQILLRVEDPSFETHKGLDMKTKGAGLTTITQSLAKRVGFRQFSPGVRKIRQTGYAMGLETRLSKSEILTLWLDTVPMGRDRTGKWITGFHAASEVFFGKPLSELSREEFIQLVAIPIAPAQLNPLHPDNTFNTRVERITRLIADACAPESVDDVWLEGCASSPSDTEYPL